MATDIDYTNQSQVFPDIPASVNPFALYLKELDDSWYPQGSGSPGYLVVNAFAVSILALGSVASFATLVLLWLTSRNTGRNIRIFRRIQRSEGTYISADTVTWIPLSMFIYWVCLLGQQIVWLQVTHFKKSQRDLNLWRSLPMCMMYIQGHFFAFSMLFGGMITSGDVWLSKKIRLPPPWLMNFVQFFVCLLMVAMTVAYTIKWNFLNNRAWDEYVDARQELIQGAGIWVQGQPMNAQITVGAMTMMKQSIQELYDSLDTLRTVLILWLVLAFVPLAILGLASTLLLNAVRTHIRTIADTPGDNIVVAGQDDKLEGGITQLGSLWHLKPRPSPAVERRRMIAKLCKLERSMIVRICSILAVVLSYFIVVVIFLSKYAELREPGFFFTLAISLPWFSIIYGVVVIRHWLSFTWKEYKESCQPKLVTTVQNGQGGQDNIRQASDVNRDDEPDGIEIEVACVAEVVTEEVDEQYREELEREKEQSAPW